MSENDVTPPVTAPEGAPAQAVDEDYRKRYADSTREAQRLKAERDLLAQQLAQVQRPLPVQRSRPEDRLAEIGVDPAPIREMLQAEIAEAFAPIARGIEARSQVVARYPDYTKFEADVAQFVNSDPEFADRYNRMFRADPAGAMELAILKFTEEQRRTSKPGNREREREASHAAIPSARTGESRRPAGEGYEAALQKAYEDYQQNPNSRTAEAYARMRLHRTITEEHLNS